MRIIIILIFVIAYHSVFSQMLSFIENDSSSKKSYIWLDGGFNTYSNSINMNYASQISKSGYIDNELKQSVDLGRNVLAYNNLNSSLNSIVFFNKDSVGNPYGLYASFSTQFIRSFRLRSDLYRLMMFGNSQMAGREADISDSRVVLCDYQKLAFGYAGLYNSNRFSTLIIFNFGLVKGQRMIDFEARNTSFYTAETGEYLDLKSNAVYSTSDQGKRSTYDVSGLGFAAGLTVFSVNKKHDYYYQLSISDFGFINWKHQASRFVIDTNYHFEGIIVNDIFNSANGTEFQVYSDTLDKLIDKYMDTIPFSKAIPANYYFELGKTWQKKYQVSASVFYQSIIGMPLPRFAIRGKYKYNKFINPLIILSHGGMGKMSYGVGFETEPFANFKFLIHSPDVVGLINSKWSYATGLNFSMMYGF